MVRWGLWKSRFLYHAVHCDASVGADCGTRGAAYAGFRCGVDGIVVSSVVHILGLQREHVAGTRYHAQVTALASFAVNVHSTYNSCHNYCVSTVVTGPDRPLAIYIYVIQHKYIKKCPYVGKNNTYLTYCTQFQNVRNRRKTSVGQKIKPSLRSKCLGKCENLFIEVAVGYMESDSLDFGIGPQLGQIKRCVVGSVVIVDILGDHVYKVDVGPRSVG